MSRFSISLLVENAITEYIDTIGNLRANILKDHSHKEIVLQKYTITKDSIAVILKDEESVVGVLIGSSLDYEDETLKTPWLIHNFDTSTVYYFSEIFLDKHYRTHAFVQELYVTARDWICSFQKYDYFTVVMLQNREEDLQPNHKFWMDNGYHSFKDLMPTLSYQSEHRLEEINFWIKKIK